MDILARVRWDPSTMVLTLQPVLVPALGFWQALLLVQLSLFGVIAHMVPIVRTEVSCCLGPHEVTTFLTPVKADIFYFPFPFAEKLVSTTTLLAYSHML